MNNSELITYTDEEGFRFIYRLTGLARQNMPSRIITMGSFIDERRR